FKCNAITRFLMGAYGFGEHETHHMHPGIPYYLLPAATAVLAKSRSPSRPGTGTSRRSFKSCAPTNLVNWTTRAPACRDVIVGQTRIGLKQMSEHKPSDKRVTEGIVAPSRPG